MMLYICPRCGVAKKDKDFTAAIHQHGYVIDIGFRCDCGYEFGFEYGEDK